MKNYKYINNKHNNIYLNILEDRKYLKEFSNKSFFKEEYPYFKDFIKLTKIIENIILNKYKVIILTDFDSDGTNSSIIAKLGFNSLGIESKYHIEPREKGYGLHKDTIKKYFDEGYKVLITADFGIRNIDEIKYAKELGMIVILTDHHICGDILPNADIIINPTMEDDIRINKLCGATVVYKVMKDIHDFYNMEFDNDRQMLHFSTTACIGDLVSLQCEYNYLMVKEGLVDYHKTLNGSLRTLINKLFRGQKQKIQSSDLSFGVVPVINSVSRLGWSNNTVDYFLSDDKNVVDNTSNSMIKLNNNRKDSQRLAQTKVYGMLKDIEELDDVVVISLDTEKGVCGLVASYITQVFGKPSIVLTNINHDTMVGSARSVGNFSIYDALNYAKSVDDGIFKKFGGHKMAAGMSINADKFNDLKFAVNEYAKKHIKDLDYTINVCGKLKINDVIGDFISEIEKFEPTGMCNEKPIFEFNDLEISEINIQNGHTFLTLKDANITTFWAGRNTIKAALFFIELTEYNIGDKLNILCSIQDEDMLLISDIIDKPLEVL